MNSCKLIPILSLFFFRNKRRLEVLEKSTVLLLFQVCTLHGYANIHHRDSQ